MAAPQSLVHSFADEKALNDTRASSISEPSQNSIPGKTERDVEKGQIQEPINEFDPTGDADERVPAAVDPTDPNIVDWEQGKDDPARAINWTTKAKWRNMAIIGIVTFLSPLASSMVAPGIPLIMKNLHFDDQTIASFIVSIYILGYAVGPLFLAPLSEVYGRLPLYHANNIMFIVWNIACALAPNVGSLLFFRLMAGISGSCPLTIGGGSIADLFRAEERGAAMAIYAMGPLMGPVLGPVAGGFLAQAEGWRWVFWVIAIAAGVACTVSIIFMRETYEPVLLEQRVKKLRKETNNPNLRSKLASNVSRQQFFMTAITRPTKMLLLSPIVFILSLYMAITYGYLYLLFTTIDLVYITDYHFSQGSVGLTYLGIGLGSLIGIFIFGSLSDRTLKAMTRKNNGVLKPEYRLPLLIPGSCLIPIGLFWYGWSAQNHLHWIMPIIGTGFVGLGMLATFMPIQTYLVDAFTVYAASAVAAATVFRSLLGAFLPLAGPQMYAALGLGWGNSVLGFIACAFIPVTWALYKYGERIRKSKWDKFAATNK